MTMLELQNAVWRYHHQRQAGQPWIAQIRAGSELFATLLDSVHQGDVIAPSPPAWKIGIRVAGVPCFEEPMLEPWDFRPLDGSFEPIVVEARK